MTTPPTAAACLDALTHLNPLNVNETHATLSSMLDGLQRSDPPPVEHLQVLEAARLPLELVQEELAKRYAAHPLPPDSTENRTLHQVVELWQVIRKSYISVAHRGDLVPALDDQRALLAQRRIAYASLSIWEYYRAHRMVPQGLWREVHHSYAIAERQGVAALRAPDPLVSTWNAQSAAEAFIAALLVELANPYGRSKREFDWICRWARHFAPYCELIRGSEGAKETAYGLDLSSDHGLRPVAALDATSASFRRFDGSRLAEHMREAMARFRQGASPSELGLGEDCSVDAAAKLLVSLYRPWGLGSVGRRFRRRSSHGKVELTGNWDAIGFHILGRPFEQPHKPAQTHSLRSDMRLLTFGEAVEEIPADETAEHRETRARKLGFGCEKWNLLDQSVGGFRLGQKPTRERLAHQQLVGVRPPDSERFLIGQVSWLLYRDDGTMEAGISLLDGLPEAIAVRPAQIGAAAALYEQGFFLPEVAALGKAASLVLPGGWFRPERIVEIREQGGVRSLRLKNLLLRGTNFDQISFEAVSGSV